MIKLTKKQILMLHSQLIQETGGSDGLRDEGLLESALEAPFQSYGDQDLFPTVQAKAARLGYGLTPVSKKSHTSKVGDELRSVRTLDK
jgi:death-on-curing protein